MSNLDQQTRIVESEILACQTKLQRMKMQIPWVILSGVAFSFIAPFIPRRRSQITFVEEYGYSFAVILFAIMYGIVYLIFFNAVIDKTKKRLRKLKLKKHLLEKENNL
ncbi:MAG: hypothetical protein ABJM06_14985 [Gilvibacter sp.]